MRSQVWKEGWTSARRHQLNLRCGPPHPTLFLLQGGYSRHSKFIPTSGDAKRTMRLSLSDLDLRRFKFCLGKRTKAVGILIGVVDLCFLTTAFLKCVQLLWQFGYTPLVTSACYSIGILYALHLIGILACWYGITKELSSWIVPKIVLKSTTVLLSIAITCVLTYFITSDPRYIGERIARGLNADYVEHKSAIDIGTTVLVTVSAALAMGQTWLLVLLISCYKDTREKELQRMLEKAMRKEKTKEEKIRKEETGRNGKDGLYTTFI